MSIFFDAKVFFQIQSGDSWGLLGTSGVSGWWGNGPKILKLAIPHLICHFFVIFRDFGHFWPYRPILVLLGPFLTDFSPNIGEKVSKMGGNVAKICFKLFLNVPPPVLGV